MLAAKIKNFALMFHEAANKGIFLIIAAFLAIVIANSDYAIMYDVLFNGYLTVELEGYELKFTIGHFINDFLMVIFFLLVGLEIKGELVSGNLSTTKQRILPVAAAIGGVILPAILYMSFNYQDQLKGAGWAIPTATDIAFALGVFALFGRGLPPSLRVLLAAIAIIDDLIAVLIIAIYYSSGIQLTMILCIILVGLVLHYLNRKNVTNLTVYCFIGFGLWYLFLKSGIHTTVAGVMLALFIPIKSKHNKTSPLALLERILSPFVAYLILPLFAFANSGVMLGEMSFEVLLHSVTIGIIIGLFVGKQLGIYIMSVVLIKLKIVTMPKKAHYLHLYAVAVLCGIGFTMSLFIGNLAFAQSPEYISEVKIGVLTGSLLSAIYGALIIRLANKYHAQKL